jgi:hypothetical protein
MKRQKELARLEWQAEKAAKRKQRSAEKRDKTDNDKDKPSGIPSGPRPG